MELKNSGFFSRWTITIIGFTMYGFLILLNYMEYIDFQHGLSGIVFFINFVALTVAFISVFFMYRYLRKRIKLFSRFFEDGPFASLLVDPSTGKIISANKTAARFYGWPRKEFYKLHVSDINSSPVNYIKEKMNLSLNMEESVFCFKHKLSNGELRDVRVFSSPILLKNKKLLYSIIQDTSAEKKLEKELVHAKEKAETNDRLKTAFLKNISHEIRTPMNGIIGFANLLKKSELSESEKQSYINVINSSANQLLDTIEQVLELSALESGSEEVQLSSFNLNNILDEIYNSFKPKIKIGFTRSYELSTKMSFIESDKEKIKRIFSCLISNAIKFTPSGEIKLGYNIKDLQIEFFVSDTGIGIPLQEQTSIFDKFYSFGNGLTGKEGGSGLGLTIAKNLVEMMNGRIRVNSLPGKGSRFTFSIGFKPAEPSYENSENSSIDITGMNILVAEDEPTIFHFLRIILSRKGAEVQWAQNGLEAFQMVQLHKPDLVLMDIKMPVMDGLIATSHIKALYPDMPVIAQTAYSLPEERDQALNAGCSAFITKPIKPEELFKVIHQVLFAGQKEFIL